MAKKQTIKTAGIIMVILGVIAGIYTTTSTGIFGGKK